MIIHGPNALRFGSVLGRIGIAWGCAALLHVFCAPRVRLAVAAQSARVRAVSADIWYNPCNGMLCAMPKWE